MNTDIIGKLKLDSSKWLGVLEVEADIYEKGVAVTIRILSKGEELMLTMFNYPSSYELVEPQLYEDELIEDYGEEVTLLVLECVKDIKAAMIEHFLEIVENETIQ